MKIIRTGHLTGRQKEDIKALEKACRLCDQTALTFPTESGCLSFLLYGDETLLSAFSAYFENNGIWECTAFTLPKFRRKGCFTSLLQKFLEEAGENELIFPADETCTAARLTLKAIGAEPLYRELMMERTLPEPEDGWREIEAVQNEGRAIPLEKGSRAVFQPPLAPRQEDTRYTVEIDGQKTGAFHLMFQERCIYLYGLEISGPLRGKGFGTGTMEALIWGLSRLRYGHKDHMPDEKAGLSVIRLQVAEENKPALSLYRKMGFHTVDSLTYYVY